jgi:hypothetical protein
MIALRLQHRSKVHLTGSLLVPLSAHAVWGQMRHFTYFVGLDPFHANVRTVTGSIPTGAGTPIVLGHRFGPFRLDRVGRILRWRDEIGYSFSDLSRSGPRHGFPHIFTYELRPRGKHVSRLIVTVRGRWSYTILPGWLIRRWLLWVLGHTLHSVRNQLLAVALQRAQYPA